MAATANSPLPVRFAAWMHERFPLMPTLLFVVLYLTVLLFGRWLTTQNTGGPLQIDWRDIIGFSAVYGFFLMLRIFDEHKDYDLDRQNFPERVLSRGLITLRHLKVAGALAIAAQIGVSLWFDGGFGIVTLQWLAVFGWSLLMLREFFVAEWLRKRLVLYALSHMLIMPLAELWMARMGAGPHDLPLTVLMISALSFTSGMSFEIARKLKAPEDERETVDSYTKILGVPGAAVGVFVCLALSCALQVLLVSLVYGWQFPLVATLVLGAYLALTAWMLVRFSRRPSARTAKACEGVTSVAMLVGYIVVLVTLLGDRGAVFTGGWS